MECRGRARRARVDAGRERWETSAQPPGRGQESRSDGSSAPARRGPAISATPWTPRMVKMVSVAQMSQVSVEMASTRVGPLIFRAPAA